MRSLSILPIFIYSARSPPQTAETVEAIVTQLMEKQRVARTASLNKQLECGCPDSTASDKPCIHQQQAIAASAAAGGGTGGGGGGRKVQDTQSEAHTTSGDRPARAPSSRAPRGHHAAAAASNQRLVNLQRMQQQLRGENNNHGGGSGGGGGGVSNGSYSQVSSTTENLDHVRHSPDAGVVAGHHAPSPRLAAHRGAQDVPPHLVLSVSQVQTSNGLLILNSGAPGAHHPQPHLDPVTGHMVPGGGGGGGHLSALPHLAAAAAAAAYHGMEHPPHPPPPPPPPRSDSLDGGSVASSNAVSSAVRSLNSLSDFTLDVTNGNYDSYPPVVTDTMLGKGQDGKDGNHAIDFKPGGLAEMEAKPGDLG